jgi:hypothetical protein
MLCRPRQVQHQVRWLLQRPHQPCRLTYRPVRPGHSLPLQRPVPTEHPDMHTGEPSLADLSSGSLHVFMNPVNFALHVLPASWALHVNSAMLSSSSHWCSSCLRSPGIVCCSRRITGTMLHYSFKSCSTLICELFYAQLEVGPADASPARGIEPRTARRERAACRLPGSPVTAPLDALFLACWPGVTTSPFACCRLL